MSISTEEITELDSRLLTTTDNPFNPHTDYDKWRTWDESNGYYTESYIARVANIPVDMDLEDDVAIEMMMNQAIESILEHDVLNVYQLV